MSAQMTLSDLEIAVLCDSTGVIAVLIVLDVLITKHAPWLKSPDE